VGCLCATIGFYIGCHSDKALHRGVVISYTPFSHGYFLRYDFLNPEFMCAKKHQSPTQNQIKIFASFNHLFFKAGKSETALNLNKCWRELADGDAQKTCILGTLFGGC
jgi:hypothetical protein